MGRSAVLLDIAWLWCSRRQFSNKPSRKWILQWNVVCAFKPWGESLAPFCLYIKNNENSNDSLHNPKIFYKNIKILYFINHLGGSLSRTSYHRLGCIVCLFEIFVATTFVWFNLNIFNLISTVTDVLTAISLINIKPNSKGIIMIGSLWISLYAL